MLTCRGTNEKNAKVVQKLQGYVVDDGNCIANHMRTGEIVDLANERRLSAVLDFTSLGGELLILNGGSRAEELVVVIVTDSHVRTESRSAYCIDSGTSLQLDIPIGAPDAPANVTVRIIGERGEMILAPPRRSVARRFGSARAWSTMAAALVLILLAGGRLDTRSAVFASADPEPAAVEAPLISPNVSLQVPAHLPNVVAQSEPARKPAVATVTSGVPSFALRTTRTVARKAVVAFAEPASPLPHHVEQVSNAPAPLMTDLRVPSTAKSGDFVHVSFGAVARQVKIVASIGPTVVSKTIIGAQHGSIAIRSPKSDLDSRVMTVRAYAQDGNRTSTLQAMVVLVHP